MHNELIKRIITSILLLPIIIFLIIKGSFYFSTLISLSFILSVYEWQKMRISFIKKIIGIIFLFFSFYSMYKMRIDLNNDYLIILFIMLICISTDIGGYIFGKTFKGPKLTKISPNKTYSGLIGSYLLSYITFFIVLSFNEINSSFNLMIFIFIISSVSQLGDITISYFKRLSNIKDTGKVIPGHGGILDRIDGMIFVFPVCYIILLNESFKIVL